MLSDYQLYNSNASSIKVVTFFLIFENYQYMKSNFYAGFLEKVMFRKQGSIYLKCGLSRLMVDLPIPGLATLCRQPIGFQPTQLCQPVPDVQGVANLLSQFGVPIGSILLLKQDMLRSQLMLVCLIGLFESMPLGKIYPVQVIDGISGFLN